MEIKELKIFSNKVNDQENFYQNILGFNGFRSTNSTLEIQVGDTKLILEQSNKDIFYHYAFLIPTGTLNSAIDFLEKRSIDIMGFTL